MKLRKRGAVYWYDARVSGKRHRGSTGTGDYQEAKRVALECLSRVKAKVRQGLDTGWTLVQAVEHTIEARWAGSRNETTATINAREAVSHFGDVNLSSITPDALYGFVSALRAKGLSPATINRKLAALSAVLSLAHERGHLKALPKVPRLRETEGRIRWLTPEEEHALLGAMLQQEEYEARALTMFLLDTGFRLGEALRIAKRAETVHESVTIWETKADRPRTVPLTERAAEAWSRGWESMTKGSYYHAFKRACEAAGIEDASPHTLRHTCASRLVQRGVPLKVVQEWLGHRSIHTTMRYAHLSPDNLRDAAKVLEARPKPNLRSVK